jgi:L,D-transpeptidase ErfK/SrfK
MILFLPLMAMALTFDKPSGDDDVVGELQNARVKAGENFLDIARRYNVGYFELVEANPGVDPAQPKPGTELIVPTQYVLPDAPKQGVVINLAELRLYYYPKDSEKVYTFPLGIGRQDWQTPMGHFTIIEKMPNPIWRPPKSIREQYQKETGEILPKEFAHGPENPLGNYAMRLSNPMYLLHGTNDPSGIGRRTSSGCIRMYPEDIKRLFHMVSEGTHLRIVNQPYKAGWHDNELYLEAHLPLQEQQERLQGSLEPAKQAIHKVMANHDEQNIAIDWTKALKVADYQTGLPIRVTE